MIVFLDKKSYVPTNFVPAVAVIRRGLVLFVVTRCKKSVGGLLCSSIKTLIIFMIYTIKLEFKGWE